MYKLIDLFTFSAILVFCFYIAGLVWYPKQVCTIKHCEHLDGSLSVPCVLPLARSQNFGLPCPYAVNRVMIRKAPNNVRMFNDCYYMLKRLPSGSLVRHLPALRGYHGKTVLMDNQRSSHRELELHFLLLRLFLGRPSKPTGNCFGKGIWFTLRVLEQNISISLVYYDCGCYVSVPSVSLFPYL